MHTNKRGIARLIEVLAGIFLLLSTLALVFAYLLSFEFTSPDQSMASDFLYMTYNTVQQKTSAIAWMVSGSAFVFLLPFYLLVFYRDHSFLHVLNALIITFMALVFFRSALAGIETLSLIEEISAEESLTPNLQVLTYIRDIILLTKAGISAFGVYVLLLSISRFRKAKINIFGRILLLLSGPVLILFTWLEQEHILFNASFGIAAIGMLIYGASLVNKGMVKRFIR